jgi:hypothetical protein
MSVHLSQGNKSVRSPMVSSSSSPPAPLLDAALMSVVQQPSRSSPSSFDRNPFEQILMNFPGMRPAPPMSSSPSPKLPKGGNNNNSVPPPTSSSSNQHHMPLLTAHSFLYNPVESCIVPIAIPPGFPLASPDFMRLFTPNMAMGTTNNSRSTSAHTPPESNQQGSSATSANSRPPHYRQRYHQAFDPHQFPSSGVATHRTSHPSYQRQKACYTCGDLGHLAFACPEQYLSDSNYSVNHRTGKATHLSNITDGYKLDYRPRQSLSSGHHHHYQRQMRSNSKTKGN